MVGTNWWWAGISVECEEMHQRMCPHFHCVREWKVLLPGSVQAEVGAWAGGGKGAGGWCVVKWQVECVPGVAGCVHCTGSKCVKMGS